MQKIRSLLRLEVVIEISLLALISGLLYLIFVPQFGYFNDDWYLMYAAGAKGSSVFWGVFSVDRPLRALVMIPAYTLFGANPLYYNLSAFLFRLISGLGFLWVLRIVWPGNRRITFWMSLLFLVYPGFLSQPNAIDYLCHLAALAAAMLSIGLTLKAVQATQLKNKILLYAFSILLGWFYLGQMEWFIGLEFFRFACIALFALRLNDTMRVKGIRFFQDALPALLIPSVFLVWRLFFFESERGATDIGVQLGTMQGGRMAFIFNFFVNFFDDLIDVIFRAWWSPLRRLSAGMGFYEWLPGLGIFLLAIFLLWLASRVDPRPVETGSGQRSVWKREAFLIALGAIAFGLFPVNAVGRSVDFRNFSRYALIASVGAAILIPVILSYISNLRLQNILFGILIFSASLTHYFNGLIKTRETDSMNQFWWQVSWRIPQMKHRTTLLANYPVVNAEEEYFIWGPANLIYYPDSMNEKYPQPGIYSLLISDETVERVLAGDKRPYSNRRSIRTYPNYGNILILSQPTSTSCVQVISGGQTEYSSSEDKRIVRIGSFSDAGLILTDESFRQPPQIPFGLEPEHAWCYYYEKASFARQLNDWNEVLRLANEAFDKGFAPQDEVEWIPFLQAYAVSGDLARLREIKAEMNDPYVLGQACQILGDMTGLSETTHSEIAALFCSK
ncbi:MAG: hypothetical protein HZB50_08955 [Chloroflexi bacterium]|nr:hypothetical protein [Chloroflexota bacterium]